MGNLDTSIRDLDELRAGFEGWLRARDHMAAVLGLSTNDGGAGSSNSIFFASVTLSDGPAELVVRAEPGGLALFPSYDIAREFRVMRILAERTGVPVPRCRWLESDPTLFGTPFLVMDRVPGEIPTDRPPYLVEGMIVDATDDQRARLWQQSVELLGQVHTVDWKRCGLEFLGYPDPRKPLVGQELDSYEQIYRWGRQGAPDFPEVEHALRWLRSTLPPDPPPALVWGDARLPNFVYRDFEPVCLIDWETARIGAPESDLAWFLLRQLDRERGGTEARARPGGFLDDDATVLLYQEVIGREARDLAWFRALNAFKTIAIKQRHYDLLQAAGHCTPAEAEAAKRRGGLMLDLLLAAADT